MTREKAVGINPTWAASIDKQLQETRDALRGRDPARLAILSGVARAVDGGKTHLRLAFWGRS